MMSTVSSEVPAKGHTYFGFVESVGMKPTLPSGSRMSSQSPETVVTLPWVWRGMYVITALALSGCSYTGELSDSMKFTGVRLELRVVVYRKRVHHLNPKNYQLDLFSPDDGYFEYSAVATNLTLTPHALWSFAAGCGAQEKTFAETKGGVCPRRGSHQSLRGQQRLAPTLHPRA
jgi:hypothetical protein